MVQRMLPEQEKYTPRSGRLASLERLHWIVARMLYSHSEDQVEIGRVSFFLGTQNIPTRLVRLVVALASVFLLFQFVSLLPELAEADRSGHGERRNCDAAEPCRSHPAGRLDPGRMW